MTSMWSPQIFSVLSFFYGKSSAIFASWQVNWNENLRERNYGEQPSMKDMRWEFEDMISVHLLWRYYAMTIPIKAVIPLSLREVRCDNREGCSTLQNQNLNYSNLIFSRCSGTTDEEKKEFALPPVHEVFSSIVTLQPKVMSTSTVNSWMTPQNALHYMRYNINNLIISTRKFNNGNIYISLE